MTLLEAIDAYITLKRSLGAQRSPHVLCQVYNLMN